MICRMDDVESWGYDHRTLNAIRLGERGGSSGSRLVDPLEIWVCYGDQILQSILTISHP